MFFASLLLITMLVSLIYKALFSCVCIPVELWTSILLQSLYIKFSTICYVTGTSVEVDVRFMIKPLDYSCFLKRALRK